MGEFPANNRPGPENLWHCAYGCSDDMVYPLGEYVEESPGYWKVMLRCPSCDQVDTGTYTRSQVDYLEDELDRAFKELLGSFEELIETDTIIVSEDSGESA